jgi:DNA-directed RNA polymerase subunit alpha
VKNISFSVEHARVGNRTDFEKLKLDLTTDGTITPQKALEKATKILMESFSIILKNSLSDFDASIFDTDIVTNEELHFRKLLKTQIKDIAELSTRSVNCLEGAGLYSLHDLLGKSLVEIKSIKSFGTKSYNEVKEVMAKYNLQNK